MKIPLFSKMTAKSRGRKVVRASARAMRGGEEEYDEAEPNMKLSHAFMVVLILHVVAVGGIYAFNHIKVNKNPDLIANLSSRIAKATGMTSPGVAAAPVAPAAPQRQPGDADEPLPMIGSEAPVASAAALVSTTKPVAPVAASAAVAPAVTQTPPPKATPKAASGASTTAAAAGTYKVVKGDNHSKIAKKLGVTSQALLQINSIEDPTKLQIDQVLKVPAKAN